ncbi:MAG: hypothetical protein CVT95_06045 [Bacteroidetes bacterium HGW-Bacteroidetes-12]|nr:MAG: hypothetical protein CVT95_06045 [Bacteroidetes bacterium HGW-Bacteroidetes-12]
MNGYRFIIICTLVIFATTAKSQESVSFLENKGQWHNNALFKAELKGGYLYLEQNRLTFNLYDTKKVEALSHNHNPTTPFSNTLNWHAYSVDFVGGNLAPTIIKKDSTLAYFNYFLGNDKTKWATDVRGFKHITYQNIYNGIDFVIYSTEELKYDFIVHPNANPKNISLKYNGADKLEIKNGRLVISTSVNTITEEKPYAYQLVNGKKVEIACNYVLKNKQLSFEFPNGYDKTKALIIDPTLIFSAFSGSFSNNFGYSATFDSKGFLYSGSSAFGNAYPTTLGAYSTTFNGGGDDIAISKFDTSGTFLIYSTFLGGNNAELPHSLIVNSFDELFVLGTTSSPNYPTTANAYDNTFNGGTSLTLNGLGVTYTNGSDIIVSRLNTAGNVLLASTYIGGSQNDGLNSTAASNSPNNKLKYNYADEVRGEIDIDENNNVYIVSCTRSTNFPIVGNVFQPNYGGGNIDACVIKLDNNLQNIIWSSFLGGNDHDAAYSLAIDNNQDLYLTGGTNSPNFPITTNGLQTTFNGGRADGFITKVAKNGSQILNSSYYGSTAYDQTYFIELDKLNDVYVFGQTEIQNNTFIQNALWSVPGSGQFVSKLTPEIDSVIYSTVFGSGNGINISPTAFLVDLCNKIYLTGWGGLVNSTGAVNNSVGNTNGMPITSNAFQSTTDGSDFYIMVMEDDASNINYGSYFGGPISAEHVDGGTSRFDRKGKVYQAICAGCGGNSDLPIAPPTNPFNVNNNSCNLGIFKMDFDLPVVVADFDVPPIGCAPFTFTFNNTSLTQSNTNFSWNFGDGSPTSTQFSPSHTYNTGGTYTITLIVSDTLTCNLGDTIQKTILILSNNNSNLAALNICPGETEQIGVLPNPDPSITYTWTPSAGLSDTTISNPFANPTTTTVYQLFISNGICIDTLTQIINVNTPLLSVPNDTILCFNETALLSANSFGTSSTYIWSSNNQFSDTLNTPITSNSITTQPNVSTTYYVSINNNGCALKDSVNVLTVGEGNITNNSSICIGDTVTISYTNTNSAINPTYNWSPTAQIISGNGTSTIIVSPSATTTYTVIATNFICIDTLTHTVTINIPQLATSNNTVLCNAGDTATLFASTTTGANIIWSSSANFNDTLNPSFQDTILVTPSTPSYYYVLINVNGCVVIDSVFVGIASSQTSVQDVFICIGDTVAISVTNLNPFDSLFHDWQPNSQIISGDSTNTILVSPTSTTQFFVVSENSLGCIIWDSILVTVDNLGNTTVSATADNINLYQGESTVLHATPSGFSYLWVPSSGLSNPNSQNPIATPNQTTTYTVTISGQNCSRTASVTIFVNEIVCGEPDVFIPNAFTPNNDGENDVLFVRGRLVEKMELKIYNRWGELVFESNNQTNGWDGTYKDELVQPNVFVYYLKVYCVDGQEYFKKGNVTVIR